jgi:hypothetical protein
MLYECKKCNKIYKTYQTLWKHNKIFHNNNVIIHNDNVSIITNDVSINKNNVSINKNECIYCNKIFKSRQNKWEHQTKHCKDKIKSEKLKEQELELEKIKLEKINEDKNKELELEKIKLEKMKEEKEILKLKIKLQNCKRLDNKTFKAVNKFLMDRSFKNSNNNNINSQNNNTINNYQILSIGDEQLREALTFKEKKQIMNARLCSLDKIVEIAHCGKYTKFKNIVITNLKDNFAYKYDENKGFFVTVTKTEALGDLVSYRTMDIEAIYNELSSANKIDDKTKELIQKFMDQIENSDVPYYDVNEDIKYTNYKSYKINDIKILLYNNQDKITKDIALLFTNESNDTIEV